MSLAELQDQENLDEAREISAFMRRKRSGDIKFLGEELKNDMHALQVHIRSFLATWYGALYSSLSSESMMMSCIGQLVLLFIECGVACNAPEYKPLISGPASLLTAVALALNQRGMLTHPALWH